MNDFMAYKAVVTCGAIAASKAVFMTTAQMTIPVSEACATSTFIWTN